MRKGATKVQQEDKGRKGEMGNSDNQYYLPQPQHRVVKTPVKEMSSERKEDKNGLKMLRKTSHGLPIRTLSIAHLKYDTQNVSKEQDTTPQNKYNLTKKVELRKLRSSTNFETPKRSLSKSGCKLQISNLKKESIGKRLNLKIETPNSKKQERGQLQQNNFDVYYNSDYAGILESKTIRVQKRLESNNSHSSIGAQLGEVYTRCQKLIQDYQHKLQNAKLENKILQQENERLKEQNQHIKTQNSFTLKKQ